MVATLLDGRKLAKLVEIQVKNGVEKNIEKHKRPPGLGVLLVGDNPASKAYVSRKEKVAKRAGVESFHVSLPEDATQEQVLAQIEKFNSNPNIDGILLQLPVPKHLDSAQLLQAISPIKDADGLHPLNQGLLMGGLEGVRPCTPAGVMRLIDVAMSGTDLKDASVSLDMIPEHDLSGKSAVVIGRSILVGKPAALMLLEKNATVSVVHSRTKNIEQVVAQADIVVAAVGRAHMVKGSWIKPGAIVIDVGINRLEDGSLTGDVDFKEASEVASAITPVPGAVGPMTVAMLIWNTYTNWMKS